MTAQPIAPVIPSPRPPGWHPARQAGCGPAAALSAPADAVYGTGPIDASGRVTDHVVSCALGWRDGDRLTLTAEPVGCQKSAWPVSCSDDQRQPWGM